MTFFTATLRPFWDIHRVFLQFCTGDTQIETDGGHNTNFLVFPEILELEVSLSRKCEQRDLRRRFCERDRLSLQSQFGAVRGTIRWDCDDHLRRNVVSNKGRHRVQILLTRIDFSHLTSTSTVSFRRGATLFREDLRRLLRSRLVRNEWVCQVRKRWFHCCLSPLIPSCRERGAWRKFFARACGSGLNHLSKELRFVSVAMALGDTRSISGPRSSVGWVKVGSAGLLGCTSIKFISGTCARQGWSTAALAASLTVTIIESEMAVVAAALRCQPHILRCTGSRSVGQVDWKSFGQSEKVTWCLLHQSWQELETRTAPSATLVVWESTTGDCSKNTPQLGFFTQQVDDCKLLVWPECQICMNTHQFVCFTRQLFCHPRLIRTLTGHMGHLHPGFLISGHKHHGALDEPSFGLNGHGVASAANAGNRQKVSGHICHLIGGCRCLSIRRGDFQLLFYKFGRQWSYLLRYVWLLQLRSLLCIFAHVVIEDGATDAVALESMAVPKHSQRDLWEKWFSSRSATKRLCYSMPCVSFRSAPPGLKEKHTCSRFTLHLGHVVHTCETCLLEVNLLTFWWLKPWLFSFDIFLCTSSAPSRCTLLTCSTFQLARRLELGAELVQEVHPHKLSTPTCGRSLHRHGAILLIGRRRRRCFPWRCPQWRSAGQSAGRSGKRKR